ncbi:Integrator complex subunit 3 [Lamellibrachia satsuma]|nr:Integrator complex subunit 3 [Lamellibrachia satsuma]
MDKSKITASNMFITTILETKDDLDEKLEKYSSLISKLSAGSDREANDAYQAYVCKGQPQHEEVQLGLLYNILCDMKTDTKTAATYYRDMTLTSRDGLTKVLTVTNQLIYEKWIKMQDTPRTQLLWFAKELVKNGVTGADSIIHSLIRQIAGGDVSAKNIWLTESVLDILTEHRQWLDKLPQLLPIALYTFLRVIVDHGNRMFHNLRQREVEFCISLLREKWTHCIVIGRDLVRLLQYVARTPEFEKLWRDMLHNPTAIHPQFTGVLQLLKMRTSKRFFVSRLTPDMENKLLFLTSKVKFGQQKRYQDWLQRQYLSTPESQSLRCDLIRYICAVIHPSNELLCSDIIPRWAVIGWLLTTCTSNVAASNAKLSLFYDWLFFDPEHDSIMAIEPCILVMHHSMRPHPAITATLLDFMCRIMSNFYLSLAVEVKQGIYTSLRCIVEKRVLPSLSPLFDNSKLDKELRSMIRENFQEFCSAEAIKDEPGSNNNNQKLMMAKDPTVNHLNESNNLTDITAEFSEEEEDDIPLPCSSTEKLRSELKFQPIKEPPKFEPIDITEHVEQLDGEIKRLVTVLQKESDNEAQCELMDQLMQTIIREEFDQDTAMILATCLCQLTAAQLNNSILPHDFDDELLEDSIGTPLFVIFRNICQTPEEDPSRQPLLMLLEEMSNKQTRIAYLFLYFLKVSKVQTDEKMLAYKDFCKNMENRDLKTCLMTDLTLCQEDDVRLFSFLIPDIYTQFPSIAIGNSELLHLIVSSIDATQLQDLVCEILRGHLEMFRKDSFLSVLNASLDWDTIEQYFLWQLIATHNIPVEHIMPILPKLDFAAHSEALSCILIQLKQDCPTEELLRPILRRECKKNDFFTVSILKFWAQEYEDKLAELLHSQLTRCGPSPNKKRQKHPSQLTNKAKDKDQSMIEPILSHLEHMRQSCRNVSFLMHELVQQGLQHVQTTCPESLKSKYSDLLALVEDIDEMKTTRVLRAVPSRRASMAAAIAKNNRLDNKKPQLNDESDSPDSSEEEDVKPPKNKKARKSAPVILDEDD